MDTPLIINRGSAASGVYNILLNDSYVKKLGAPKEVKLPRPKELFLKGERLGHLSFETASMGIYAPTDLEILDINIIFEKFPDAVTTNKSDICIISFEKI